METKSETKPETKRGTILVVEDDRQIRNFICHVLTSEGYANKSADTGRVALALLSSERFDIVLLDLGLPDMDGMELIEELREWSQIPIIVVSARDQDKEKAAALDAGADDYLTKPFSETELMARIRVALRHAKNMNGKKVQSTATVGELKIDFEKRLCFLAGKEVRLTPTEYSLLSLFFKNMGKVLTARYIMQEIWNINYDRNTETLRTHMASLRRKIEENSATPRYLLTEIGVGYRLADV